MNTDHSYTDLISNTFLIRGFDSVQYAVYHLPLRRDPLRSRESSPLADRIKCIDNLVSHGAVLAAAAAMLVDEHKLIASWETQGTDDGGELCVFGMSPESVDIAGLDAIVKSVLTRTETGFWSSSAPEKVRTEDGRNRIGRSLCRAVKFTLERALLRHGCLRLERSLILSTNDGSDSFLLHVDTFLSTGSANAVGAKVSVERSLLSSLRVQDVEELDGAPVSMSPSGVRGTLCSSKDIGHSLAESVVNRWHEAGLIGSVKDFGAGDNDGETDVDDVLRKAVYVELQDGSVIPFPTRSILIERERGVEQTSAGSTGANGEGKGSAVDQITDANSRKRPREDSSGSEPQALDRNRDGESMTVSKDAFLNAKGLNAFVDEAFGVYGIHMAENDEYVEKKQERHAIQEVGSARLRLRSEVSRSGLAGGMRPLSNVYFPRKNFESFGEMRTDTDAASVKNEVKSMLDEEDKDSVPVKPETERPRGVTFVANETKPSHEKSPSHSIPVDCASLSAVLQNSAVLVSEPAEDFVEFSQSPSSFSMPSNTEVNDILRLVDMQVVGRNVVEDELLSPPAEKDSLSLPLGVVRRTLAKINKIFQDIYSCRNLGSSKSKTIEIQGPVCIDSKPFSVTVLDPPQVCTGFRGDWIETSNCIIPFWEKACLEPFSDEKYVVFGVIAPSYLEKESERFFRDLKTSYQECSLGKHQGLAGSGYFYVDCLGMEAEELGTKDMGEYSSIIDAYRMEVSSCAAKMTAQRDRKVEENFVVYVIPPVRFRDDKRLGALIRSLASLLSPAVDADGELIPSLIGGVRQLQLKILPQELLRPPSEGVMDTNRWPVRAQLIKSYAFSVYNMLRSKTVSAKDDGPRHQTSKSIGYDQIEFWSPVTPEYAGMSLAGNLPTAKHNGTGNSAVEEWSPPANLASLASTAVQEASSVSFLYEPAMTLTGVGKQSEGTEGNPGDMLLHLCYKYCPEAQRYSYAWTDSRGEFLDVASLSCAADTGRQMRRVYFSLMLGRGQRWHLPYVRGLGVVISKVGPLQSSECEDWDFVVRKLLEATTEESETLLCRRFPPEVKQMNEAEGFGNSTKENRPVLGFYPDKFQQDFVQVFRSVSLLELDEDQYFRTLPLPSEETSQSATRQRDLLVAIPESGCGGSEAAAYILRSPRTLADTDSRSGVLRVRLYTHFGIPDLDKRPEVDGADARAVTMYLAKNLYDLCAVGSPPCWPLDAWQPRWPIHVQAVRSHAKLTTLALSGLSGKGP
uniref:Mediator of RNA polymerase II transcription subunit 13 n=1 Tax=Rhodosorus marinus TaxID=101924 RepID=A0A7S2ZQM2_9RHOD|mmetsp:Transcript_287/g.699  ORF Transcript_287/g.699 Transcript_287/m.699 type:complete len:1249 (+) Transcript_287:146-3892(+)|eukprot:CAMPEP_0113960136 /NCGR_PEP_ID=MMETSP0011_2-20120614/4541_1 /TAXON_ID=101924 /ORGANISM="Rhodosorus marinus" /LENGTH=1248 /DNA_ID=CAMNT_0000971543 /DNA_START=118 /DNA_END=3864 /DNA_ORIENTATION=- /assembly_acc=CAM_ASM_000156